MKSLPIFCVMDWLLDGSFSAAQDRAKIQMPELAFLKKLEGKWQAKGVFIQGDSFFKYKSGQTSELKFENEGVQFIHNKSNGPTKRLLQYENIDLEKNEIDLFYKNEKKRVSRYSLKLKDGKVYIAIRSDVGKQDVLPDNRLPDAENLAWEYKRLQQRKKTKNKKNSSRE